LTDFLRWKSGDAPRHPFASSAQIRLSRN